MPIALISRYSRELIKANRDKLFVFGDNYMREGTGGQAKAARGEPNTAGIRTKFKPTYNERDFLKDEHYGSNVICILHDFTPIFKQLHVDGIVVWPKDGVGTGIAQLQTRAPETLKFIETILDSLKKLYGVTEIT